MGRTADTLKILADGDTTVYTIKSISHVYSSGTAMPTNETATTVKTATGLAFDKQGEFIRDGRGELVAIDRKIFFMPTATSEAGYRLERAGSSEYDEVVTVRRYSDHLEVFTKEVKGR